MSKVKGKIAAASMSAGSSAKIGAGLSGKAIEEAMAAATMEALADGITDSDEILKLKLAARERVKDNHRAAVARAERAAAEAEKAAAAKAKKDAKAAAE